MCTNDILFAGISWWSIWILVGVAACLFLYEKLCKVRKITPAANKFYYILGIISIILGFMSASLVQSIYNFVDTGIWDWGGVTFLGGMFGGALTFILGTLIFARGEVRAQFGEIGNIALACIPTAHAFGRIGCFSVGCCYGAKVHEGDPFAFLGVTFKNGYAAGQLRYPTQLFEAVFLFILAAILIILVVKDVKINAIVYFGAYGIFRFFIEFLRDDERGSIGLVALTPSQVLSIVCMIIAVLMLVFKLLRKYKPSAADAILHFFRLDDASTGGWTPWEPAKVNDAVIEQAEVSENAPENESSDNETKEN